MSKVWEVDAQTSVCYTTYRIEADTKEEALKLLEDDSGSYEVDSDGEYCFEVLSVRDVTYENISDLKSQLAQLQNASNNQTMRLEAEIKRLEDERKKNDN